MKIFFISISSFLVLFCSPVFADFADGQAAYDSGNYAAALKEWKPIADQGIVEAQFNLGIMYLEGHGVTQDYEAALEWFKLSAELLYVCKVVGSRP